MNREILFRGKRLDNGEWVTGRLITDDRDGKEFIVSSIGYHWEEDNGSTNRCMECFGFEVDPETVGQYTGLKDKNGVKIFEGDIVNYHTIVDCRGIVQLGEYEQDGSGDEYAPSKCIGFFIERKWVDFDDDFAVYEKTISLLEVQGLEVIGTIHDNPELLEVQTC